MATQQKRFKTGDIVILKSGGPPMTVLGYSSIAGMVYCQWLSGERSEQGQFPEDSLEPAPANPAK
jgi:uncharacterized protein YodC (DUF2158 family)